MVRYLRVQPRMNPSCYLMPEVPHRPRGTLPYQVPYLTLRYLTLHVLEEDALRRLHSTLWYSAGLPYSGRAFLTPTSIMLHL